MVSLGSQEWFITVVRQLRFPGVDIWDVGWRSASQPTRLAGPAFEVVGPSGKVLWQVEASGNRGDSLGLSTLGPIC